MENEAEEKKAQAAQGLKKTHLDSVFITMSEVAQPSGLEDNLLPTQTKRQVLTIWWVTHDF